MNLSRLIRIRFEYKTALFSKGVEYSPREQSIDSGVQEFRGISSQVANDSITYFVNEDFREHPSFNLKNIKVIGHRGSGENTKEYHDPVENTIDSFNLAIAKGAQMVELDVHLTRDKKLVVYHDDKINGRLIANMSSAEFFELTGHIDNSPSTTTTLKHIFDALPETFPVYVEIKYNDIDFMSYPTNYVADLVEETIQLILNSPNRRIMIASFSPTVCALAKSRQHNLYVLLLVNHNIKSSLGKSKFLTFISEFVRTFNLDGLIFDTEFKAEIESVIQSFKARGLALMCYGIGADKESEIIALLEEGITGICTNDVDACVRAVKTVRYSQGARTSEYSLSNPFKFY